MLDTPRRPLDHAPAHRLQAVSLFTNCGAADFGYAAARFEFVALAERDPRRLAVAHRNHPGAMAVAGDLRDTWPTVVAAARAVLDGRALDLLVACPPCQGMSTAQGRRGAAADPDAGARDGRNLLVIPLAHAVAALRPRAVVVENVPAFLSRQVRHPETGAATTPARLLLDLLAALGAAYASYPVIVNFADFGVPQSRRRALLTLLRCDEPANVFLRRTGRAPYPRPRFAPDHGGAPVTLGAALADAALPPLDAVEDRAAFPGDPLHAVPVWAPRQRAMVAAIPPGSGASAWENVACPEVTCGMPCDDPEATRCVRCGADLLRPVRREPGGGERLARVFRRSSYRRMRPDAPASTVTTASGNVGSDHTLHPWESRVLSPRECCVLQTIPGAFDWGDALAEYGHTHVRAMIGEAVPPCFTEAHGRVLGALLAGQGPTDLLRADDPRCRRGPRL